MNYKSLKFHPLHIQNLKINTMTDECARIHACVYESLMSRGYSGHHSSHRSSLGYIVEPFEHWKALVNSSLFTKLPSTLNQEDHNCIDIAVGIYRIGPGLCGSVLVDCSKAASVNSEQYNCGWKQTLCNGCTQLFYTNITQFVHVHWVI